MRKRRRDEDQCGQADAAQDHDAGAAFLAAAARIPESLPEPVELEKELRVFVSLKRCSTSTVVVSQDGLGSGNADSSGRACPVLAPEDFDGLPGTVSSDGPDEEGRWAIEVTRRGNIYMVLVPRWSLLWNGAAVLVRALAAGDASEVGLLAAGRPARETGSFPVQVRKRLALRADNLRVLGAPPSGGADAGGLRRGTVVSIDGLRQGTAYNGASGVLLSSCPDGNGRWEVVVNTTVWAEREQLRLAGDPAGLSAPAAAPARHPPRPPRPQAGQRALGRR
eukprot:CAMPEP_0175645152 /NCGR_PEP_ID=MMETSP0097-20121207/6673_1 /TAXON_ID=311494 /ORGANISM="Alexandrium monilatum, Strain CCMP3105" /LENGTH=278 /DNA_ID=CAMNT_0016951039 /DNA_START=89 /DNA_END=922 /DNA_ORIENTATION=+